MVDTTKRVRLALDLVQRMSAMAYVESIRQDTEPSVSDNLFDIFTRSSRALGIGRRMQELHIATMLMACKERVTMLMAEVICPGIAGAYREDEWVYVDDDDDDDLDDDYYDGEDD